MGENLSEIDLSERISDAEARELTSNQHQENSYYFSFDLRNSPLEDTRQYVPLLNYLQEQTGYSFKIRLSLDTAAMHTYLQQGKIDFLAIGGMNYVVTAEQFDIEPLVRGVNHQGKTQYRAVIVVPFDSPIDKVSQLKGKRFAFGSEESTQGHLIPRMMLLQHGISVDQLGFYAYTGSHKRCAESVIRRQFDACGMQDTLAQLLAEQGQLRILSTSKAYASSGIAVTKSLDAKVKEKVLQALLKFDPKGKDKSKLYHWDKTEMPNGFIKARASDYDGIKALMQKLNLLPATHVLPKDLRRAEE